VFWPREIIERDHEIQNPFSPEKIRRLGDYLRLSSTSRVLDVACGKGGPARILASTYGSHITGIEIRPDFADAALSLADEAGLGSLISVETADAAAVELDAESFDAALCLGATFVWGTIADAAAALRPLVPTGGFVAIGEPYWRRWPLPEAIANGEDLAHHGFTGLAETVARFEQAGFEITGIIGSSVDDWDHYRSLQWRALEEWLSENPDHPHAGEVRAAHDRSRRNYFRFERVLLGDAIFVGRKAEIAVSG
jgi:SAM-dependent methyltransferase